MHNYYGKIVWEIGSIFIGGGLAFIGFAASEPKTYPFFGFFALAFTILMTGFYFMNKRWRDIAEIHLLRCRQIEDELGLSQHWMAKKLNYPAGFTVLDGTGKRWFKASFPSGWSTLQGILFWLTIAVWIVAFYLTQIKPA